MPGSPAPTPTHTPPPHRRDLRAEARPDQPRGGDGALLRVGDCVGGTLHVCRGGRQGRRRRAQGVVGERDRALGWLTACGASPGRTACTSSRGVRQPTCDVGNGDAPPASGGGGTGGRAGSELRRHSLPAAARRLPRSGGAAAPWSPQGGVATDLKVGALQQAEGMERGPGEAGRARPQLRPGVLQARRPRRRHSTPLTRSGWCEALLGGSTEHGAWSPGRPLAPPSCRLLSPPPLPPAAAGHGLRLPCGRHAAAARGPCEAGRGRQEEQREGVGGPLTKPRRCAPALLHGDRAAMPLAGQRDPAPGETRVGWGAEGCPQSPTGLGCSRDRGQC